ncbi:MAG TPA: P-loop NTPase fold protein [Chthoniobacteraceae bacterium]|nr:P-loop NTPase fold protein [Chthoniobacteraceae bacterium]
MSARLPTHNDQPTFECKLQRAALVEQVAREIADGQPSLVFGIHGDWGSGKTSFLCQLANELSENCLVHRDRDKPARTLGIENVFTVWFDAWRYQHEPSPVVALLHEICHQLPLHQKLWSGFQRHSAAIIKTALETVSEVTCEIAAQPVGVGVKKSFKFKNPFTTLREQQKLWDDAHFSARLTTDRVRDLLSGAMKKLLGWNPENRRRVCVIIDDLDRCDPPSALKLLEGIKIHLSLPECVFVLGVNLRQIERAIAPHLPGAKEKKQTTEDYEQADAELRAEGAEYLEKLCSYTWKLPFLSASTRAAQLRLLLGSPPHADAHVANTLPAPLIGHICDLAEEFDCLPANPRKIKALANTIRQLAALGWPHATPGAALSIPPAEQASEADRLLVAASIYQFHPELLRFLQTYLNAWTDLVEHLTGRGRFGDKQDFLSVIKLLRLPAAIPDLKPKPESPTPPRERLFEGYIDPVGIMVFRIQKLLVSANAKRNSMSRESMTRYLLFPEVAAAADPAPDASIYS